MTSEKNKPDPIKIVTFVLGAFSVNTMLIADMATSQAAVIDPGGRAPLIAQYIMERGYDLKYILLTHCHIDHVAGLQELKNLFPNTPIAMHPLEKQTIDNLPNQAAMFNMPLPELPPMDIDLRETPNLQLGELKFSAIHTPGHTPGSVCYYFESAQHLFTGDLLFRNSVGRTDLGGGSIKQIRESLQKLLQIIPDPTEIYPGHGSHTKMEAEKASNPFLTF